MWPIRAYIPKYVNRDTIVKCLTDKYTQFISVATEQEAVKHEAAKKEPFCIFNKDHFTIHNSPQGTVKCSYWSRNAIVSQLRYTDKYCWKYLINERDGYKVYSKAPFLLFTPVDFSSEIRDHDVLVNSVVVNYEAIDIERFAQTLKEMVGCNQKFFVVAKGSEFELIDAKDTDIRVLLDSRELCYYIRWVSDGVSCIRERMEEVHFAKVNPPKRLPNGQFKLLDYLGNEVHDGQIFNLVYDTLGYGLYSGMSDEEDDDFDDFVNNIYGEYRGLSVFNDSLTLYPKSEAEFTSETIDGIVYLKCGGKYVYCPLDGEEHIKLKSELPKKDERLHLECNGIEVYISRWNKCGYISEMVGHRGVLRFPPADAVDPLEDGSSFSLM